jgi:cytochrome b561
MSTRQQREVSFAPAPIPWRYSAVARALHWIVALLIVFTTALGWRMMVIEEEPGAGQWFDLHRSIGLTIFTLVALRLVWRLTHSPEPLPDDMPGWQRKLAAATHWLLYVLMVVIPITGYVGASYTKSGVQWFGRNTPQWATPNHDLAEQLFDVHGTLVWVLVALVALHVAGALKHWLIDKDGTIRRMGYTPRR